MIKKIRPTETNMSDEKQNTGKQPTYNAVPQHADSLLIRKKRHFGGLMCPPMGMIPTRASKDNNTDRPEQA